MQIRISYFLFTFLVVQERIEGLEDWQQVAEVGFMTQDEWITVESGYIDGYYSETYKRIRENFPWRRNLKYQREQFQFGFSSADLGFVTIQKKQLNESVLYKGSSIRTTFCYWICDDTSHGSCRCDDTSHGSCRPECQKGTCTGFVEVIDNADPDRPQLGTLINTTCTPWTSLMCFETRKSPLLLNNRQALITNPEIAIVDCSNQLRQENINPEEETLACSSTFIAVAGVPEVKHLGCKVVPKNKVGNTTKDGLLSECFCEESLCNDPYEQMAPIGNDIEYVIQSIRQLKMDLFEKVENMKQLLKLQQG